MCVGLKCQDLCGLLEVQPWCEVHTNCILVDFGLCGRKDGKPVSHYKVLMKQLALLQCGDEEKTRACFNEESTKLTDPLGWFSLPGHRVAEWHYCNPVGTRLPISGVFGWSLQ